LVIQDEQPLPDPIQAVLILPVDVSVTEVPPTAIAERHEAGNDAVEKPESPEETTIATPGWL